MASQGGPAEHYAHASVEVTTVAWRHFEGLQEVCYGNSLVQRQMRECSSSAVNTDVKEVWKNMVCHPLPYTVGLVFLLFCLMF